MTKLRMVILGPSAACMLLLAAGCYDAAPANGTDAVARSIVARECVTPEDSEQLADQVLQLINLERAAVELPPVAAEPTLEQLAADYACRMVAEGFFAHRDPETGAGPGERAVAANYAGYFVGENLAAGHRTAAAVMKVWMESPAHRRIILDRNWKEVGVAVRTGGEYSIYWVLEFGNPADF